MPLAKCNKCNNDYEFKEAWFKKNDPEKFVCRKCKIKIRTQSSTYKKQQKLKSKKALANKNTKERMSQIATLNNIKNADKISIGLKKYFSDHKNRQKAKKISQKKWQDPSFKKTISDKLKLKWQDPEYRGKVLGSRVRYKKRNTKLYSQLSELKKPFIIGYTLAAYEFDALINEIYLYDSKPSTEKRLFIEHYFSNLVYIDNLDSIKEDQKD